MSLNKPLIPIEMANQSKHNIRNGLKGMLGFSPKKMGHTLQAITSDAPTQVVSISHPFVRSFFFFFSIIDSWRSWICIDGDSL